MKWHSAVIAALSTVQLLDVVGASSAEKCQTFYATTPVTKVSTSTKTATSTFTAAQTEITTITRTTTNKVYTFTTSIGRTTTTIPTSSGFTPIISATSLPGVTSKRRRDVVLPRDPRKNQAGAKAQRAASSSVKKSSTTTTPPKKTTTTRYAHNVVCTSTVTKTAVNTTPYSTVIVSKTVGMYATSTTHVATATVHAACQGSDNIITTFKGHEVSAVDSEKHYSMCSFSGGSTASGVHSGGYACMDPRACCEIGQSFGFSGFRFDNATGENRCITLFGSYVQSGGWVFYDGENDNDWFFGSAGTGGGTYGGANPEPGCSGAESGCSS